ncbi:MAG: hypothetical protein ACI9G1_005615 [Pirellulaceae bacterium]|jgi:hypothetical protein
MTKNCPSCKHELTGKFDACLRCGHETSSKSLGVSPIEIVTPPIPKNTNSPDIRAKGTLWKGTYSGKAMLDSWMICALVTLASSATGALTYGLAGFLIGLFGIGAIAFGWLSVIYIYRTGSVKYTLTDERLTHRHGFFSQITNHIEVLDVDDVTLEQTIIQRLIGVGAIKLHTSDNSHPVLWLRGIDNVQDVAEVIELAHRRERHKRALHVTAI